MKNTALVMKRLINSYPKNFIRSLKVRPRRRASLKERSAQPEGVYFMARFTASIDDNLKARLDTYAKDHGYNRSEALEVMIRAFFKQKADAPQPAPTPPPETPSSPPPSTQPGSARLDELEKQMEQLQAQLRVGTPSNVRLELMEMQVKFQSLLIYLEMQLLFQTM